MKKTSIKVFGVCAATLLTIGAVAPVAVHAEEVTAPIAQAADNVGQTLTTQDNLKKHTSLSVSETTQLVSALKESKGTLFNTTDVNDNAKVQTVNNIGNRKLGNHTTSDKPFYGLTLLFNDSALERGEGSAIAYNLPSLTAKQADDFAKNEDGYKIIMATDISDDHYIQVGDEFTVSFWANYVGTNNPDKYTKLGETKVKVETALEALDYSAHATNINAQIGDLYNPTQNVTVKNKKNGYTITNPVVIFADGTGKNAKLSFFGRDNVIRKTELTYKEVIDNAFQNDNNLAENENIQKLHERISDEFGYNIGQYYILADTSNFANLVNIKQEQVVVGTQTKLFEYYNSDVKDFNQQLSILIPTELGPDNEVSDSVLLYANRMINVTGEGEGETPIPEETKVPVYRAYNPNNGDHLFTTSLKEYNEVVDKGWAPEGLAWNAATEEDGTKPVYRLYNPNSGEHFYTDSEKEYNEVAVAGWNKEGIAFYSAASEDGVKIFRSFNPNATGPGSHMFTDSEKEYNELTAAGWSPEGVAFYGIK